MAKLRDVRFKKTDLSGGDQFEFDQDMLKLLMSIDESKTLLQVANETKMGNAAFKECFLKLYKLKLIEKVEEKLESIDGKFLENVRAVLVRLLGPLGEVLMEDAAEQIGAVMPDIPKKSIVEFVRAIAAEIPGEKQKDEFQKVMFAKINSMSR